MRAHQIMPRQVVTVGPDTTIVEAAWTMLQNHIGGLSVVDASGQLVGIVSQSDFIRRAEIGTQQKHAWWLTFLRRPGSAAGDFVHGRGRGVGEVMMQEPFILTEDSSLEDVVDLIEKNHVKRLPVTRGDRIVDIVSRSNLLQAVAGLASEVPDPTADDDHFRDRVIATLENANWTPFGLNVIVLNGAVHLQGVISDGCSCNATNSAEDDKVANTGAFG
jgi:CBS domain-containing protein